MQNYITGAYNRKSNDMADKLNLPISRTSSHNDVRDAFRHVYTSARVTQDYGFWAAETLGERIERYGNNTEAESWMDARNNQIGREIGLWAQQNQKSEEEVAEEILRRIDNGEIVTNPYDPRRTFEVHGDWERAVKESKEALQSDLDIVLSKNKDRHPHDIKIDFHVWNQEREKEIERQRANKKPHENDGDIFVHAYERRNGDVKSHHRSKADNDMTNNRRVITKSK